MLNLNLAEKIAPFRRDLRTLEEKRFRESILTGPSTQPSAF